MVLYNAGILLGPEVLLRWSAMCPLIVTSSVKLTHYRYCKLLRSQLTLSSVYIPKLLENAAYKIWPSFVYNVVIW